MYRRVSGELKPNPQEVWTRLGGANRLKVGGESECSKDESFTAMTGFALRLLSIPHRSEVGVDLETRVHVSETSINYPRSTFRKSFAQRNPPHVVRTLPRYAAYRFREAVRRAIGAALTLRKSSLSSSLSSSSSSSRSASDFENVKGQRAAAPAPATARLRGSYEPHAKRVRLPLPPRSAGSLGILGILGLNSDTGRSRIRLSRV
ncbi:hypothetical protein ALC57_12371 [Trachymyrmex cornetzi]|uniref:Uncharacterized protein n=1 Tax=Trachymyrmex cornetzi TaxID=471704 RepID=A0A195DR84_9HYME|nr:hypothetical protein ALC57_12371 [Trachymyrmex cornetzi]